MIKNVIIAMIALVAVAAIGVLTVIQWGIYDVAATRQHTRPVYAALRAGLSRSVAYHSRHIEAPELDAGAGQRGLEQYHEHCAECHGAPGVAPEEFALGMTPLPINLLHIAEEQTPAEIYWTIKHGIKMTGMPAWEYRLDDAAIWDLAAFIKRVLPSLSPEEYRRRSGAARAEDAAPLLSRADLASSPHDPRQAPAEASPDGPRSPAGGGQPPYLQAVAAASPAFGDPARGARAIPQYGCPTCHVIPGIIGRKVHIGPPLRGIAGRNYIGGELANTPDNMMRWLLDTHGVEPSSAMPTLGLKPSDAADIAAYLYTLERR